MKARQWIGTLIVVAAIVFAILVVPKRIDAPSGVIRFPFYQGTHTMDVTRDMISALGWQHLSEGGNIRQVTFRARDGKSKVVTFDFIYRPVGTKVVVSTEADPQYSVEQVANELGRRLGVAVDGVSLAQAAK